MPVQKITAVEFEQRLQQGINNRDPEIDALTGPVRDIVVSPVAVVLEDQNDRIRNLSLVMSLRNVSDFSEQDLDDVAFNEEVVRRPGTRATTTVFFQTRVAPTVDITIPVNLPVATPTDPTQNRNIIYRTIETKTLPAATAALFFNAGTGFYELEVAVQAISAGGDSNVAFNRINQFQSPVAGFEFVTNRVAATDGKDREDQEDLATRLLVAIPGSDISTPFGIIREVLDNFADVTDIELVYGLDPLLLRADSAAGAVDAYIIGSVPATIVEAQTFLGVGQSIVMDEQPVLSIASVDAGGPAFVQGVDYEFVPDEGVNAGSIRAQDAIVFLTGGAAPAAGTSLNITYNQNSLPQELQDNFITVDRFAPGRDLLFKEGTQIDVEIEADLKVLAGTNATSIQAQVVSTIVTFINSLGLGDDAEQSDVNSEVRKLPGVDNLVFTVFRIVGSGATTPADVTIERNEYARITSANVTITLV